EYLASLSNQFACIIGKISDSIGQSWADQAGTATMVSTNETGYRVLHLAYLHCTGYWCQHCTCIPFPPLMRLKIVVIGSDLDEFILGEHTLGFLPAHFTVRTCVLARCWRNLWMSTARTLEMGEFAVVQHLLLLRWCAPINTFDPSFAWLPEARACWCEFGAQFP
ncbi:hypothetical protein ABZP36_008746, partial [Zizania latifolia]